MSDAFPDVGGFDAAAWAAAGFSGEITNGGKHLTLRSERVFLSCWPTSQDHRGRPKWMAYARVFHASADEMLGALRGGRIRMPDEFDEAECRSCQATIWWGETSRGKRIPLDADGQAHFTTCPNAAHHRQAR